MSRITITGIDQDGNQRSETIEVQDPNRTFYSLHRYKAITPPQEPGLRFVVRLPNVWERLMRFFGFRKWRTVKGRMK